MTSREKNLLTTFLAFAVVVGGGMLGYGQVTRARDGLDARAGLEQQRTSALSELERLRELEDEFATNQTKVERVNDALPTRKEIPELIRHYEDEVIASGLTFNGMSVSNGDLTVDIPESGYVVTELGVTISAEGTKSEYIRLLQRLESDSRFANVVSVSIGEPESLDATQYTIPLKVYYIDSSSNASSR